MMVQWARVGTEKNQLQAEGDSPAQMILICMQEGHKAYQMKMFSGYLNQTFHMGC